MSQEGILVPIGALTGIEALAGFGQKINLKIIPISNVECRFVSKFLEAGKSMAFNLTFTPKDEPIEDRVDSYVKKILGNSFAGKP